MPLLEPSFAEAAAKQWVSLNSKEMCFRSAGPQVLSRKTSPLGSCLPAWEYFSSFPPFLCLISNLLVFSISFPSRSSFLPTDHLRLWFSFVRISIYFFCVTTIFSSSHPHDTVYLVQLPPAPGFASHQVRLGLSSYTCFYWCQEGVSFNCWHCCASNRASEKPPHQPWWAAQYLGNRI